MKLQIFYNEVRKSHYWLGLLRNSKIVEANKANELISNCEEIIRILNAILQSSKK